MSQRVARILSLVFQPMLTGTYVLLAIALTSAATWTAGVAWGIGMAVLTAGIPSLDILRRIRGRTVADFSIFIRRQRLRPLLVALTCTGLAFIVSLVLEAPHQLQASLLAALVTGAALASVTGAWKISFHAAAIVGAVAILAWYIGWEMLALAPLVPAVAWSRVVLGRHTLAQVLAGLAVGSALTILVLILY